MYTKQCKHWHKQLTAVDKLLTHCRHVSVALQVTEKLISECDTRKLQLIVNSYLNILHSMLETNNTELHIMATNSVSVATCLLSQLVHSHTHTHTVCKVCGTGGGQYSLSQTV